MYDPTCGTGGMLISTAAEVKRQGKESRSLKLYGQELNHGTSAIARMNLVLHGIEDGHIAGGMSTLSQPAFLEQGRLKTFDIVLANPPYSIKTWDRDLFATDPYGRNIWGVPPQNAADYAFIQHIAKSLDPHTGRAAILLPHGVLTRYSEAAIRTAMIQSDIVEAVIGLPRGLFYNSAMEAIVLVVRAHKPATRAGKVLFVNAANEYSREQAQSFLRAQHQRRILHAYETWDTEPGFTAVATLDEIGAKAWSLAIPLYVETNASGRGDDEAVGIETAVGIWRESAAAADEAIASVLDLLRRSSSGESAYRDQEATA